LLSNASYLPFLIKSLADMVGELMLPRATKTVKGDVSHKKCPYCAEIIKADAIKCKHCGSMLDENE
jgi:hypothetical protein